jgi:hypothetical protein
MVSLRAIRKTLVDFVVPLALAWLVVAVVHARYGATDPTILAPKGPSFGAVRLKLQLPGTWAGIEEPILTCGKSGNATFVYLRIFYHAKARVGIEFWGIGSYESPEFDLPAQDAQLDVACSFPGLFPKAGSPEWEATPPSEQEHLLGSYTVSVNGVVRLKGPVRYAQEPHLPVYLGTNPLGGSFVSNVFTGRILAVTRQN